MLSAQARVRKPFNAPLMVGRTLTAWEKVKLRWHYAGPWRLAEYWMMGVLRALFIAPLLVVMLPLTAINVLLDLLHDKLLEPLMHKWFRAGDIILPQCNPTAVARNWDCIKDRRFMDALVKSELITADERHELEEMWK